MDFTKFAKLDENGRIVHPPRNDGGKINVHHNLDWLAEHGFEEHTDEWFAEHTPPIPEPDYSNFNAACEEFRTICGQIADVAGLPDFKGGFDEMSEFKETHAFGTSAGLQLAIAWSAMNELCKYEGSKVGLGQPQWWYRCWGLDNAEKSSN